MQNKVTPSEMPFKIWVAAVQVGLHSSGFGGLSECAEDSGALSFAPKLYGFPDSNLEVSRTMGINGKANLCGMLLYIWSAAHPCVLVCFSVCQ